MWPCRVKVKGVIICWANLDAFCAKIVEEFAEGVHAGQREATVG